MKSGIDRISSQSIGGWIEIESEEDVERLQILIDGTSIDLNPTIEITSPSENEGQPIIAYFTYLIDAAHHGQKNCDVTIAGPDGTAIPPSPIKFLPHSSSAVRNWRLEDVDHLIIKDIENTFSYHELQAKIKYLSQWFGRGVDRANALHQYERNRLFDLESAVAKYGDLGGALGHLIGVIKSRYPEIEFPRQLSPLVSIIIPVHNKFDLTYNCLKSIKEHLPACAFEIIIVDDFSSDETLLSSIVFQGNVRVVRNGANIGFVGSCNAGAEEATGQYLFFLNNDTLMKDNVWLDELVGVFELVPNAGVVGSRLINADGSLQECGGIIWKDASGWNWGRNSDPQKWMYRFRREVDYVSGAALMIRKNLFTELAGFDNLYAPAYYEDTDLCFRVRRAGYQVIVQPASTIVHLEGQSAGTDVSSGMKKYQVVNHTKFYNRWKEVLSTHQDNAVDPAKAAERYAGRLALFIDDSILTPDRDAGSNAAMQHILSLQRLGFKVVFVPSHNMADIPPYTPRLESLGVECIYAPSFWSVEDFLRRDPRIPDIIYLHRFSNADKYMNICRSLRPSSKVIFNVADLHSLRESRGAKLKAAGKAFSSESNVTAEREINLIETADATIVHSTFENEFLAGKIKNPNVIVVPWTVKAAKEIIGFGERKDIAFVGGYRHQPNVDAVIWFVNNVFPLVHRRRPDICFHIVGSHMPAEFKALELNGVNALGYVEDIDSFVARLKLTVAPLRYGAGIKGKVLTSLAQGTPCVMTQIAAEGLSLPKTLEKFVTVDPVEMAEGIISLYEDGSLWSSVCWDGIDHIDDNYSEERIDQLMRDVIQSCSQD